MKHLRLRYKFMLIMILLGLPTAIATVMLGNVSTRSINFAQKEVSGAQYLQPLSELQNLIGAHHVALLDNTGGSSSQLGTSQDKLRDKLAEIVDMEKVSGAQPGLEQTWPPVHDAMIRMLSLTPESPYAAREEVHQQLLQALDAHTRMIGDQSNLILDPDLDSYYLMDATLLKLPPLLTQLYGFRSSAIDTGDTAHEQWLLFMLQALDVRVDEVASVINVAISNNPSMGTVLNSPVKQFQLVATAAIESARSALSLKDAGLMQTSFDALDKAAAQGHQLQHLVNSQLQMLLMQRISRDSRSRSIMFSGVLAAILTGMLYTFMVGFGINRAMREGNRMTTAIAEDRFDSIIDIQAMDETGELLTSLARMQEKLKERISQERELLVHNGRMKQALDSISSVVLFANTRDTIIYCNNAAVEYFRTHEQQMVEGLPDFGREALIGSPIDIFGPNFQAMADLPVGSQQSRSIERAIGNRIVKLSLNPVNDEQGKSLGSVIELYDRTEKAAIESALSEDVHAVVQAALLGDLSKRVDGTGKPAFLVPVYNGVNDMLEICSTVITSTGELFKRMADGDFSQTMTLPARVELEGDFGKLQCDADATVQQLTEMIAHIKKDVLVLSSSSSTCIDVNTRLENETTEASLKANNVSAGASSISENVDTIAGAAEELNSSIKEIANNTQRSNAVAEEAVALTQSADSSVTQLSRSSESIGDMIRVINSIAEQTNLLALNATIEAARAGDAGKGFAVVANEVKELAKETARATEDISLKIQTIQSDSGNAATGIRAIDTIVQQINELQLDTATAMNEQTSTTQSISRSIGSVAGSSSGMSDQLAELVSGTRNTREAVDVVKNELARLSEVARNMQAMVDRFKLADSSDQIYRS